MRVTRQANPKNSKSFSVKARDLSEEKVISDLKKLAVQDGVDMSDLVFEGVLAMFKAHGWPPGNPQRQLFDARLFETILKCGCGKPAVHHGLHVASGAVKDYCGKCFCGVVGRHDPKVWRWSKPTVNP